MVSILGPLTVRGDADALTKRDRVVLGVLALRPGDVVSPDRLADALWGAGPPPSSAKVVQGCVMRLRKVLGSETIETSPQGYRLTVGADEVDAGRFERLLTKARELLALGEPERAAYLLGESLALWRGRALVDLEDWGPGRIEAYRLEEMRLEAEEALLDAMLRAGRHREVCAEARARVADAPLRERRWALLALAQYRAGLQGDALRTLSRARTVLATELGLDPGPELFELEQSILRHDPSLVAATSLPDRGGACPYPGLVPYDVGDADAFFGRDREVTDCLRRLATARVLSVVGPSGCGKSSVVRAGVAAALERDGVHVTVVTPGSHPMDVLESLPPAGSGPVLVVDQCEEAVSLCRDDDERARFFATVAHYAERAPVVIVVRADLLGEVSSHREFARLIERGLYLLGSMDVANLRAAIEGPARQAGLLLEPGLVDLLTRDVEGEPGALPLLSHALRQTWERREGRTLTVDGYRETGGIRGAVAQSAEAVYERLPPAQRPRLRDLLLRLVAPSPDGEPMRSRVPRRTLAGDADHDQLIEQLVAARLLTSDDGVVELAHEALARAWPRLRAWLDDDVDGQRIRRHLSATADAWDVMGRPDSEVYRGIRLTRAVEWRDSTPADLTNAERAFLESAERLATAERHSKEVAARRERRAKRRRVGVVTTVTALVAAALVAGALAIRQGRRADSAAVAADARRAAALALDAEDIDRSLLLAVEAVRLDNSPDTRASLLAALSKAPALIGSVRSNNPLTTIDVSPDGAVVAAGSEFYDAQTLDRLGGDLDFLPWKVAYRTDGEQIAMAVSRHTPSGGLQFPSVPVVLVDPASFQAAPVQLGGLPKVAAEAWDLAYSGDGRFLAVGLDADDGAQNFDTTVMVWDVTALQRPIQIIEPGQVWALTLSPDGSRLHVGIHDPPSVVIYDVATGERIHSISVTEELALGTALADSAADGLEISPDGTTLAVTDGDGIVLLDAVTLTERSRLKVDSAIQSLEFSHDGSLLASGSDDGTAIVWDIAAGTQLEQLRGHATAVWGLAFDPTDVTLYSSSLDQRVLAWDLRGDRRFIASTETFEPGGLAAYALPAPDGETVVHLTNAWPDNHGESTIRFLDVAGGLLGDPIVVEHATWSPTWQPPDAERLAVAAPDGVVQVWDWRRGEIVTERKLAEGRISAIAYTADGTRLIVGETSGTVFQVDAGTLLPAGPRVEIEGDRLWHVVAGPDDRNAVALIDETYATIDLADGTVRDGPDLGLAAESADLSADGRLAVGSRTGEVGLVDLRSGGWVRAPVAAHPDMTYRVHYAPDGATFATSGLDGQVRLWDGRSGSLLATVGPGRFNVPTVVSFLDDSHTAVITNTEGAMYTWDTRLEHWIEFACSVAGRNLATDEWSSAFGDRPFRETCPPQP